MGAKALPGGCWWEGELLVQLERNLAGKLSNSAMHRVCSRAGLQPFDHGGVISGLKGLLIRAL